MNHRFSEMMNLSDDLVHRGADAPDIVAACVSAGSIANFQRKHHPVGNREFTGQGYHPTDPDCRQSAVAVMGVSADGGRRRRRAGRRHHRTSERGSQKSLTWRVTTNSRRFPTGSISATRSSFAGGSATMTSGCRHCCSSISINSSRSTTPWVTLAATSCYAPSPAGCAKCCARRISWRRFGGDEFVVFQQNIASNEDAAGLARRIVDRLSERYKIDNHLVEIGASVGIGNDVARAVSAPIRC